MTPPENDRPDDEDGGTFKLKPGATGPGAAEPAPSSGEEPGLDQTMKIQRGGAPAGASTPPPPASPLGNPTGPADPNVASFAETTVMPQQAGSQTGFQPAQQQQPQQPPGGPLQQPPAPQQPYGQPQQAYPGPPPQQQPGYPQPQAAAPQGAAPDGINRIALMVLIAAGLGLLANIISIAMNPFGAAFAVIGILFAAAWGWYGWALPKGKITSAGLRMTGIVLIMIGAGFSIIGLFTSFAAMAVVPAAGVISLIQSLVLAGVLGYASFIYFKDDAVKAYIKGAPAAPGAYPPPAAQPGYPQQQAPQQYGQQPGYGQPAPQQPQQQPGAYPPPPPGYPQQGQQPPQGPYGG